MANKQISIYSIIEQVIMKQSNIAIKIMLACIIFLSAFCIGIWSERDHAITSKSAEYYTTSYGKLGFRYLTEDKR